MTVDEFQQKMDEITSLSNNLDRTDCLFIVGMMEELIEKVEDEGIE